ncbi:hypothetical protein [Egicoccus sp. AB-alg2]|uniref:hypothetical protein n=1 Tax=Egicoccus sp. AB-alg2 TaxID=3242693 RepID=UPI00359DA7DF
MLTTIREGLTRTRDDQVGGISAEFVAVLIIVAALIAAIWGSGITDRVDECASTASQNLFSESADVSC